MSSHSLSLTSHFLAQSALGAGLFLSCYAAFSLADTGARSGDFKAMPGAYLGKGSWMRGQQGQSLQLAVAPMQPQSCEALLVQVTISWVIQKQDSRKGTDS